ncbi:DUF4434 domain-containing protein [Lysobacter xanthus]
MIRLALALVLGFLSFTSSAQVAMIYQPQLRDMQVAEAAWPGVFEQTRQQGFDTIVLQYTRYGSAFGSRSEQDWLRRRIADARGKGLRVVVGLYADPDFFNAQYQSGAALDTYLAQLRQQDIKLAKQWVATLGATAISGWYLYPEVDDLRWQDTAARRSLVDHLRKERQSLASIAPAAVFISSFFAGNSAPAPYHDLVMAVQRTGVRVWVQDGAGTGVLSAEQRAQYVDTLSQCTYGPANGLVFEIFRQTSTGSAPFTAARLGPAEEAAALAQRAACGGASVFFEQRYLNSMAGTLPL